jgi:glucose/arabinose dehydrogenase
MHRNGPRPLSLRWFVAGLVVVLVSAAALGGGGAVAARSGVSEQQLGAVQLPPGFRINVFAEGLGYARMMAFNGQGELVLTAPTRDLAGDTCSGGTCRRDDGRVYLLPDRNGDGVADRTIVLAGGLDRPHGIAYREGGLYVAEHGRVIRLPDREGATADAQVVVPNLPINSGSSHWTRTLAFGNDGKLYVSAGSPCNVCQPEDERLATVLQYNADGEWARPAGRRPATGVRHRGARRRSLRLALL